MASKALSTSGNTSLSGAPADLCRERSAIPRYKEKCDAYNNYDELDEHWLWWDLPGHGKKLRYCGEVKTISACSNPFHRTEDNMKVIRNCCWKAECPVYFEKWASREAHRADERIKEIEKLYNLNGTPLGPIRHFALSPLQDKAKALMETKEGYKKLKGWLKKVLKKGGLTGYLAVFHSHRERKKPRSRSYYLKHRNDKNFTVIRRNGKEIYLENTGDWYISPHFHILGYGYLENAKRFHKETGWVYKNKGIRDSVYDTIQYLLSHCGIATEQGNHDGRPFQVLNWFGALSSHYVHIVKREVGVHDMKCKICGEQMREFKKKDDDLPMIQKNDDGTLDWSNAEDLGVYIYKTIEISYGLVHLKQLNEKYEVGESGFLMWRSKKKKRKRNRKWRGGISEQ